MASKSSSSPIRCVLTFQSLVEAPVLTFARTCCVLACTARHDALVCIMACSAYSLVTFTLAAARHSEGKGDGRRVQTEDKSHREEARRTCSGEKTGSQSRSRNLPVIIFYFTRTVAFRCFNIRLKIVNLKNII